MSGRRDGSAGGEARGVRIWLLGGFRVSVESRIIEGDEWHLKKAASLVKLLALAPGHRLHREQAMDLLWPNLGTRAASNNLRQALYAARRTLASDPAAGSQYLASEEESLLLCPRSPLWVEAQAFEEAATTARRSRDPAAYEAALDLYTGDLLPQDRYEEWAEEPRRRLRETYLSLLLGLAHLHEEHAEYDLAVESLKIVSEEPTREEAHAALMSLSALKGSKAEALSQYGRLKEVLLKELGTEPAASSRALKEEIEAERPPDKLGTAPQVFARADAQHSSAQPACLKEQLRGAREGVSTDKARARQYPALDPHWGWGLWQDAPRHRGGARSRRSLPRRCVAGRACSSF
jgi:DNA-binding SARP family transcriptional activator